ncbi:MAG: hydantoinase/oxoprolinase family protein [Chloroflexi bacterium]|nr:MAG: hydantoinase/oxoprolinase family protein [Chloroflexota bacterium]
MSDDKSFLVALDAGGTMTDTFLVDAEGRFSLGKSLTNREDESRSYMESVADAAAYAGLTAEEIHRSAVGITYTGTTMLNILITGTGAKVGLLATKGFEHVPHLERGLTWIGLSYEDAMHMALLEHTRWLVDINLVRPVAERIKGPTLYPGCHIQPGTAVVPLRESDVSKGVEDLLNVGVEAIAIVFLHSYENAAHEMRAAEIARAIVEERGLDIPVVTSYDICPIAFESERMKSVLIECYAGRKAQQQLFKVETAARANGYRHELQTLLSYGATAGIRHPRIYESIVSGPTGGLLGSKELLEKVKGLNNIICADLGGTTFDMGLITRGRLPINTGPHFYGHKLSLPMLSIDSIGAGTGTVVHVDEQLKLIKLGPESAGSDVGTCYRYPDITVGDIDLVLGYLNPDYFLGGTVKLNKEAASRALEERLARPLGQDLYDVCGKVLDLLHAGMKNHITSTLQSKGLDPSEYTLIAYGGSGPLHMWGLVEEMDLAGVVTCPWAAAFSAYGVAAADYFHRYQKSVMCVLPAGQPGEVLVYLCMGVNAAWQELKERAYQELENEGYARDKIRFRYGIYARYLGQMVSWEAPVEKSTVETPQDVQDLIDAFEKAYTTIYPVAARMPEMGYAITGVYCEAMVDRIKPVIARHSLEGEKPPQSAYKGKREVYHRRWVDFDVWEMDLLQAGNKIDGPAVIEHPMTTLIVPPENYVEFDEYKLIWYRKK